MQPAPTNRRRRTRSTSGTSGTSGGTGTTIGPQSNRVSRPGRLQTEEAVLEDIIATAGGDFTQYPDIVEISRGQLQYSPTPSIVWPNAAVLKNSQRNHRPTFYRPIINVLLLQGYPYPLISF